VIAVAGKGIFVKIGDGLQAGDSICRNLMFARLAVYSRMKLLKKDI